jgi:hypothetical protein
VFGGYFGSRTEQNMLRIILTILCIAIGTPVFAQTSGAENYPNRSVHIVVPFPAGGPTDTYARILARSGERPPRHGRGPPESAMNTSIGRG